MFGAAAMHLGAPMLQIWAHQPRSVLRATGGQLQAAAANALYRTWPNPFMNGISRPHCQSGLLCYSRTQV
jgi:hypothetical protein